MQKNRNEFKNRSYQNEKKLDHLRADGKTTGVVVGGDGLVLP